MSSKRISTILVVSAVLLAFIIVTVCVLWFNNNETPTEDSVSSNNVQKPVATEVPQNDKGENCMPESFFESLKDDDYKLVFEDDIELTWEQPEYDPNNELPPYQQTLVTESSKFIQTMEAAVLSYMEDQNFDADKWQICASSSNDYMAELMYKAELSTEYRYIKCIASRTVDTAENFANVRIYEKIGVPNEP